SPTLLLVRNRLLRNHGADARVWLLAAARPAQLGHGGPEAAWPDLRLAVARDRRHEARSAWPGQAAERCLPRCFEAPVRVGHLRPGAAVSRPRHRAERRTEVDPV